MRNLDDKDECQSAVPVIQAKLPGVYYSDTTYRRNSAAGCFYWNSGDSIMWNYYTGKGTCSNCRSICKGKQQDTFLITWFKLQIFVEINIKTIIYKFCAFTVLGFDVILDGQTKLSGSWINDGVPIPATIAYQSAEDIFIIGIKLGQRLKMVKIRVTGEHTFVWMSAKYRTDHSYECEDQLTFSEDCFQGNSVGEANYNVQLVAVATSGTKNRVK